MKASLKYVLIALLLWLQIVTVAGILFSSHMTSEATLLGHMRDLMASAARDSVDTAEQFLETAQRSADVTRRLAEGEVVDLADPAALELYFLELLAVNPEFAGVYFGEPDGGFLYVKRDDTLRPGGYRTKLISHASGERSTDLTFRDARFVGVREELDPADSYDPRTRPWYQEAMASTGVIWTEPYVFFTSREPGITTAAAVDGPDGGVAGVVGVDIDIADLSHFLTHLRIGESGSAFIMDRESNLVAYPDVEALRRPNDDPAGGERLARVAEVGDAVVGAAASMIDVTRVGVGGAEPLFADFEVGGETHHVAYLSFSDEDRWPWILAVHAPETDFLGDIRANETRNVWLAVAIGVLAAGIGVWLAVVISRPVSELADRASTDPLTGLNNRAQVLDLGRGAVARARRTDRPLSVAMVDIDDFKSINDTKGHRVGDDVLVAVAHRLRSALRLSDIIARFGGEEFVCVLPETDLDTASIVADRLRGAIGETRIVTSRDTFVLTVSVGVACLDEDTADFEQLLEGADAALLAAKARGKNRIAVAVGASP